MHFWQNDELASEKKYYPDGTLSVDYIMGKDHKLESILDYDQDGTLSSEQKFKNDELSAIYSIQNGVKKEVSIKQKPFVFYTAKGAVNSTGNFYKRKKDGDWKYFHPNGVVKTEEHLDKGVSQGFSIQYNASGQMTSKTPYVNDTIQGVRYFYRNGKLSSYENFNKGKTAGICKSFHPNGQLKSVGYYDDGDNVGNRLEYNILGKLRYKEYYVEGECIKEDFYDSNGQYETSFEFSNRTGQFELLFENQNLKRTFSLKNGQLDGKQILKDKTGLLKYDVNFINNTKFGKATYYGPFGKLEKETVYYNNAEHGLATYYDIMGTKRLTSQDTYGDTNGKVTRFYPNGKAVTVSEECDDALHGFIEYYNMSGTALLRVKFIFGYPIYYQEFDGRGGWKKEVDIVQYNAQIHVKYPNGKTAITLGYKNGLRQGKFEIFSPEGYPEYKVEYNQGDLDGERIEYYPGGKVYKSEHFVKDDFEGKSTFYTPDGKIAATLEYQNDELHGWATYFTNGQITYKRLYEDGFLVRIEK